MEERLQKILARAGFGSRRQCEKLISEGRIRVDGRIVSRLGTKVDPETQNITLDGRPAKIEKLVYYLVNKPKGYVCTSDERSADPRVIDLVPRTAGRFFTVGRLDKDSLGLIIVTNDGEFANLVMHPRYGIHKAYIATVEGNVSGEDTEKLESGVHLSDGRTLPARVRVVHRSHGATTLKITVREGRNRLIRRMLAKLGYKVRLLRRIAVGQITAKGLKIGETRTLGRRELESVYEMAKKKR